MLNLAPLTDRIANNALRTPTQLAVKFLRGDSTPESWSYADLQKRIDSVALAVQKEARVGDRALLLYPQGLDFVAAFLGCLEAGVIAVPAYPPRRNRSQHRLKGIVQDCSPSLILTTEDIHPSVTEEFAANAKVVSTDSLTLGEEWMRGREIRPDQIAYLQYTSGSTSEPKGTIITHGAVVNNIHHLTEAFAMSEDWNVVSWLPMHHDMGLVGTVLSPLYLGGRTTLLSPTSFLQNPFLWLKAFTTEQGNFSAAPNFGFDHCCRMVSDDQLEQLDLSSIRLIVNGSEPLRSESIERFIRRFGPRGFSPEKMFPSYGLAEATLFVTGGPRGKPVKCVAIDPVTSAPIASDSRDTDAKLVLLGSHDSEVQPERSSSAPRMQRFSVSCGIAPNSIRVKIVDSETKTICPQGTIGQIWVSSPANGSGYWGNDDLSRHAFQNFLANGDGPYLNTGDLGFILSDELFVTGRKKDLIILRGRNLYPQDIERLAESVIPFVETNSCAAVSIPGKSEEQLAVVVEANRELVRIAKKADSDSNAAKLLKGYAESLRQAISEEFEAKLSLLAFMQPGTFPRTSSGKVQRHRCVSALLEGNEDIVYKWQQHASATVAPHKHSSEMGGIGNHDKTSISNSPYSPEQIRNSKQKTDALIVWLRDYASRRINSRVMDERRCIPPYVVLDFGMQGLFGLQVPESFGGLNLTTHDMLRVIQQVAAIDTTIAAMVGLHNGLGMRPLIKFANDSLRNELVPLLASGRKLAAFALTEPGAGSNPLGMPATARQVPGGWRLNAEKRWIGMASWAGSITVIARCIDSAGNPSGIISLNVREDAVGVRQGRESLTMGMRSIVQNTIYFEDVFIPDDHVLGDPGDGMSIAQDAMMHCRLGIAAMCIGGMKRCAQLMLRYSERRVVSTGRLLDNPVTLTRMENLSAAIAATQALTESIAAWIDAGIEVPVEAYVVCKTSAPELFYEAADQLMQLLGGRGYIETNIAPQLLRDARVLRVFEGPTETLRMFLGASVVQRPHVLRTLLVEYLHANHIADSFDEVVDQLCKKRGMAQEVETPSNSIAAEKQPQDESIHETQKERQWRDYQIGEIATAAVLWAASYRHHGTGKIDSLAVSWSEKQFFHLRDSALADRSQNTALHSSESITDRIREFQSSIGDLQQELPGEDDQLDDYLKKNGSGKSSVSDINPIASNVPIIPDSNAVLEKSLSQASRSDLTLRDSLQNELAKSLQSIVLEWVKEVQDESIESIDIHAPFTALGIDSVGAAILSMEVEKATGLSIAPDLLYQFPSISQLAEYLSKLQIKLKSNVSHQQMCATGSLAISPDLSRPPSIQPSESIETHRLSPVSDDDFIDRNQTAQRMKATGLYFYGTSYSAVDGSYVIVDGKQMLMLASFAYTGLVGNPEVNRAAKNAIDELGAGCHGVRLIAGTTSLHRELEIGLADFVQADDALLFSSGYSTNVATIPALVGPGDAIFADEYNHASLVDGCKLSGARFETFPHNQVEALEGLLKKFPGNRRLVIVDGVYSMEGDIAPLPQIVQMCRRYSAMLMVDEAHSLGVIGKTGRGVQEHFNLPSDAIDIKMGNTSKALSSLGGFIAGKHSIVDYLRHNARGYVFSTSLGPPQVAAALKALEILRREPERIARLQKNALRLTNGLRQAGFRLSATESAIVPLLCKTTENALEMTARCREKGLFVIPIVYPAVPMNAPRLRLNVMATHSDDQIEWAISILVDAGREVGLI